MKKGWMWAVLLTALVVISACRPAADNLGSGTTAEDLGACQPEDTACEVETTVAETSEEDAAPVEETESAETVGEVPSEEASAPTDTEVSESQPADYDPFAVQKTDWVMGPEDAFITMIEYGDFQ